MAQRMLGGVLRAVKRDGAALRSCRARRTRRNAIAAHGAAAATVRRMAFLDWRALRQPAAGLVRSVR
jgi:hypothetical protein